MNGRQLWHVTYDTVFCSSQGMEKYSIPSRGVEGYVVTEIADLHSVAEEIRKSLDLQSHLEQITKAAWLGELINAYSDPSSP